MDVGNWLRNQGLERFEAAFRDNGIDESVLPHLTQDHLRELGLPLGARIKLLAAIAALSKEGEVQPAPKGAPTRSTERMTVQPPEKSRCLRLSRTSRRRKHIRPRARGRARAAGKVVGAAGRDEPREGLA